LKKPEKAGDLMRKYSKKSQEQAGKGGQKGKLPTKEPQEGKIQWRLDQGCPA